MSAPRVLITCPQMQNSIDEFRDRFDDRGIEIEPPVVQQPSEDELIAIIGEFDGMIAGDDPLTARVLEHAAPDADHLQMGRRHRRHRPRRRKRTGSRSPTRRACSETTSRTSPRATS